MIEANHTGIRMADRGFRLGPFASQKEVNAVKRSAVSTGRLRALLLVHLRPIDLVVFQEPVP